MAFDWTNTLDVTTPDPSGVMFSGSPGMVSLGGDRALLVYGQSWKASASDSDYTESRLYGRIVTASNPISVSPPVILWSDAAFTYGPGENLQIVPIGGGRFAVNWTYYIDGQGVSALVVVDANGAAPAGLAATTAVHPGSGQTRMCRVADGRVAVADTENNLLTVSLYGCTADAVTKLGSTSAPGRDASPMDSRALWVDEATGQGYILSNMLDITPFTTSGDVVTFQPDVTVTVPPTISFWMDRALPVVYGGGVYLTMMKPYQSGDSDYRGVVARFEHAGTGLTYTEHRDLQNHMDYSSGSWEQEYAPRAVTLDGKMILLQSSWDAKPEYPDVSADMEPTLTFDFFGPEPVRVQAPVGYDDDGNSYYYGVPPRENMGYGNYGDPIAATDAGGALIAQWGDHQNARYYSLYVTYIGPDALPAPTGISGALIESRRTFGRNFRT